ncbi:MAG: prolipoprotein diacylglyceryl transferase [Longimonas sp.]|uniref:prolipoprotein diacylglyceryl transferase n=1 Tax=Longimonas sp. TaxID=2039626 RepID=UPI003976C577
MPPLLHIEWNVDPVLFDLGPVQVHWYGLLFTTGFFLGYLIVQRMFVWEDKPLRDLEPLFFYVIGGAVIGARLGHIVFYNLTYYVLNPIEIFYVHQGGLASHGGGIGIIIALYLYARSRRDQPFLWITDRVVVPTILAGMFIRIGNVFNSELYGLPADVPWAFVFEQVDAVPRHPVQLYEALAYGLIFVTLFLVYRLYVLKRAQQGEAQHGLLSGLFLVLVFTARFGLEFFKAPVSDLVEVLPIDMGQLLSLPAVLLGLWLLWRVKGR